LRELALVAVWVAVAAKPTPAAHAQGAPERAMARAMFEEGVQLADRAHWAEAADRFQRAQVLNPSPAIAFNLACALAEIGKLIEASDLLQGLVHDAQTPPELTREAEAKLAEVSAKLAFLTLRVTDAPSTARVTVDGREWPRPVWGVASPIDPGAHAVVGMDGGAEVTRADVTLGVAEHRELGLTWPAPAPVATSEDGAPDERTAEDPTQLGRGHRPLYKSWLLWTGVGLVVAGGVITAALLGRRDDTKTAAPIPGNAGVIRW
jgi:hypothetical protein